MSLTAVRTNTSPADGRTLRDLAVVPLVLAALVAPWTAVRLGPIQPVDVMLIASLALLTLDAVGRGRWTGRPPTWVWAGTAAILMVAVSHVYLPTDESFLSARVVLHAGQMELGPDGLVKGLQWLVALTVLPVLACSVADREPRICRWMITAWASGSAISGFVALSDFLGVTQISASLLSQVDYAGRQAGLASHVNNMGVGCAMAIPIGLYLFSRSHRGSILVLLGLFAGVAMSGSRGSQAGAILALSLTLMLSGRARRTMPRLAVLAGAVVAFLLFASAGFAQQAAALFRFGAGSDAAATAAASDEGRLVLAQQALRDFAHRPADGIGLDYITAAHSGYLQLISAGGIILTLGVVAYALNCLRTAWRLRADGEDMAGPILVSLLLWAAVATIENQLTDRFLYVPVACIAALATMQATRSASLGQEPHGGSTAAGGQGGRKGGR